MIYKALKSFSGVISMAAGEERELKDQYLIDDLLKAGYISQPAKASLGSNARVKSNKSLSRKGGKTKK